MAAMEAAVASQTFDEIVISTLPARVSRWLRQDLTHRANRRFAVPVTTITAADDTMPSANATATTAVIGPIIESHECTTGASCHG